MLCKLHVQGKLEPELAGPASTSMATLNLPTSHLIFFFLLVAPCDKVSPLLQPLLFLRT